MRTKLRSKVTLLFIVCAVLIAIPEAAALAQDTGTPAAPMIQSDKADYAPGELVTLTGGGWQPGESVHINVNDTYGATWSRNVDVTADASGNITDTFNLPPSFVSDYDVTATGAQSGTATTTFTDAIPQGVTVSPASQTVAQGANTTYTVNVGMGGNNTTQCTVTLSAVGLPSGASATFTDNPHTGLRNDYTSTMTVSTTNATPGKTFLFTVRATSQASSCQNAQNITSTPVTLKVNDTTAPSVAITSPGNNDTTTNSSINVSGTASDASGIQGVKVNGNTAAFTYNAGSSTSGAWTYNNLSLSCGSNTITAVATDDSDNHNTKNTSITVTRTCDTTAPLITPHVTGTLGDNGWYKSDVEVSWTVNDPESTITSKSAACDTTTIINADTTGQTVSCSATSAGGTDTKSVTIKRDATAPDVAAPASGVSGTEGNNGWYTSVVSQTFNASDATSGLVGPSSFQRSSGANEEGQNVNIASGPVSDNAGNIASASAGPFKIDLSDPEANCDDAPSGWSQNDVNIHCQASDAISGLANNADADFNLSTSVPNGTETANASTGDRTVANQAGRTVKAGPISGIKVDKKAPVLTDEGPTNQPDGDNGWYKSAVTNGFKATDGGSGFAPSGDLTKSFTESSGTNEGATVRIASGSVSDAVGNSAASINSAAFKIDLSNPTNVTFVGGPNAGEHFFGDTPAKPTCTANDAVSGVASCDVTGYSTAVGTHTMTATAKDNAGRTATATRQYTVKAWTFKGFYQPVDMNNTINTVKGGSTVPIKFELLKGTTELTDTANVVQPLKAQKISCTTLTGDPEDLIEMTVTGGTSLRYDTTGGQFIYNWKTPTGAGTCYNVTISSLDGSSQTAYFKLK
jgi:hypothetical protein